MDTFKLYTINRTRQTPFQIKKLFIPTAGKSPFAGPSFFWGLSPDFPVFPVFYK
ncbi:hypothetical protein CLOSTASPAR_02107 [[Clostridium] asparagiforme DSM 15981]|uniref:Uncharacterized protein n=1 Tax=[Clostridium] asparagiforme DSM 15981 TaxID=518636 RepID=C0CYN0_9FIRM|nr:hypothetical protein CLOSTASPAR_02107 [[Clostridium] asparagiforme DSM 15981]